MFLLPRESLLAVSDAVYRSQKDEKHGRNLAVPPIDLYSYYDVKLLRDVTTIDEGLLLSLTIPYASSQTAFQIYTAQVIPMPQTDLTEAIRWVLEGPYSTFSEDSMETSVLTTILKLFRNINLSYLPSDNGKISRTVLLLCYVLFPFGNKSVGSA